MEEYILYFGTSIISIIIIRNIIINYRKKKAGNYGEELTFRFIKKRVTKGNRYVFKNLRLPLYNTTTEIDFLIITSKGLLCIENKHLTGVVKGSVEDKYWVQIKNNGKQRFYNPLMQNEGHIKCLKHHLRLNGYKNVPVYSYIVFSNENVNVFVDDIRVGTIHDISDVIQFIKKNEKNRIKKNKLKKIIKKISR
ncbi:nuclease-like protein [Natranaerovirga hydrolytica]|uniref:Nuclease-like protein n=1 Tax=Natranaerovirga hydrolytica TaxID=680378 RepID=A0A4R1M5B1_9FIRM|nr:nuclease-related domain-containing protein [Natranaerovirga hydrolytica]TCK86777.1 nuclease-like protein [Natranaerovirga hydrolytica]